MNTFLNYLSIATVFALFLVPTLVGVARDRRIDRQLREAERQRRAEFPETAGAARPVKAERRPWYGALQDQKSSSKATEPSTATW
ncbi:hypothetical protein [Streptomyces sp. NPDC005181]|uniref:hypothetical protein n=1 Tax=Streptomyces sp. NPDC005181 TaxID=3156869 RepID=UPI00339E4FCE